MLYDDLQRCAALQIFFTDTTQSMTKATYWCRFIAQKYLRPKILSAMLEMRFYKNVGQDISEEAVQEVKNSNFDPRR